MQDEALMSSDCWSMSVLGSGKTGAICATTFYRWGHRVQATAVLRARE